MFEKIRCSLGTHKLDPSCKCVHCGEILHNPEQVTKISVDWEDGISEFIRCKRCNEHLGINELPKSWLNQCKTRGHDFGSGGCRCRHCGGVFHNLRLRLSVSGSTYTVIEECSKCGYHHEAPTQIIKCVKCSRKIDFDKHDSFMSTNRGIICGSCSMSQLR
jgi:hypothetical protein